MLDGISNVQDNSIQLLLTDPPYNISRKINCLDWKDNTVSSMQFDETFDKDWDTFTDAEFLEEMKLWSDAWFPKLKKGASFAIFISDKYLSHLWTIMESTGFEPKRVWTWKKPAATPFNRKFNPISGCEYILWGIKPGKTKTFNANAVKGTIVERYSLADKLSSILYKHIKDDVNNNLKKCFNDALAEALVVQQKLKTTGDTVHCVIPNTITYSGGLGKNKIHPTQKPTEILEYFIELLTNEDDIVLDTFAGSGSTGIACLNRNRHAILIERDTGIYNKMIQQFRFV